jgi:hypothetical protein
MEIVTTPGAVNGKAKASRVAWKHGEWIFLQVESLLYQASAVTGDLELAKSRKGERPAFLVALLEDLATQGVLLTEHGNTKRAPRDAVWTVRSAASEELNAKSKPYQAIIVSTALAPHLPGLEDANYAPTIVPSDDDIEQQTAPQASPEPVAATSSTLPSGNTSAEADDPLSMLDAIDPLPTSPVETFHSLGQPLPPLPELPQGFQIAPDTPQPGRKSRPNDLNGNLTTRNPSESLMPTHNTKPLTAAILNAKIRAATTEYGLEIRQIGDRKIAIFDADEVSKDYKFDPENLPEGVKFIAEKGCLVMVAE